jgi:hypothetical protein
MNRFQYRAIALYRHLLRLYPSRFRAEFADEMSAVFSHALQESKDTWSLVSLLAGELWDLPINLLREHARERRANALTLILEEKIMSEPIVPMRAFREMTWTLLSIFMLYCLLILLPYFYHQLNLLSSDSVSSGLYDPKGYLPFTNDVAGGVLYLLGLAIVVFGLPTVAATGGVLALTLRRHWRQFQQKQRLWGNAAVIAALLMLVLTVSPLGRMVIIWFLD